LFSFGRTTKPKKSVTLNDTRDNAGAKAAGVLNTLKSDNDEDGKVLYVDCSVDMV